ncbi:MAG: NF041680 family putative transposase [Phycisphaerae bacterium]
MDKLNTLTAFRQAAYDCFTQAQDALFELTDAIMLTPAANSFVELSLSPVFRRKWPSVYEAIADGDLDEEALLRLYLAHRPEATALIIDHTAWPRLSARTLPERTFEHHPTKIKGNKPITIGLGYSTLAFATDELRPTSWALPVLHERIRPTESPIEKAVGQLRRVCALLPDRPVVLLDSEYGCAAFVKATADLEADKIMRLRSNRCLWGVPPPYSGRGRPRIHGHKFKLSDPGTWPEPDQVLELDDTDLGPVRLMQWTRWHFRKAPEVPMTIIRIERLAARDTRRDPKVFWLTYIAEEPQPLAQWWSLYLRRYVIEPWYRFSKQRLYWTLPRFSSPEQADRWSLLMPLVTWQLYLAREVVSDLALPWQKPQVRLTPSRVCRGMGGLLALIGTPAKVPKPRGKSPGWPAGRLRGRRPRYAVVKKGPPRAKKTG